MFGMRNGLTFSPKGSGNTSCQSCKYRFWLVARQCSVWGGNPRWLPWVLYDIFDNSRHADSTGTLPKIQTFPWFVRLERKNLLLETSEEKPKLEDFKKDVADFKGHWYIRGSSVDSWSENLWMKLSMTTIKEALLDIIDSNIPIVYNLNVGHATQEQLSPWESTPM